MYRRQLNVFVRDHREIDCPGASFFDTLTISNFIVQIFTRKSPTSTTERFNFTITSPNFSARRKTTGNVPPSPTESDVPTSRIGTLILDTAATLIAR